MAKYTLPHFYVVPDTNILFTSKATVFASSQFEDNWKRGIQFSELRLLIPEVVG